MYVTSYAYASQLVTYVEDEDARPGPTDEIDLPLT